MPATDLDQIVNLCKRRGFVFPSAEIYGGFRSTYDYGPLGALMLRNVKEAWVRAMVQQRDDVVLIDAAILGPPAGLRGVRSPGELHAIRWSTARTARTGSALDHLDDPEVCPSCGARAASPRPAPST